MVFDRAPVRRTRDGTFRLQLSHDERDVLRKLPGELRQLLSTDDPSLARLFPPAYHEDPERDAEYRRLMREELVNRRLESLATVEATIDAEEVTEEQLMAWLKVINDLRLVIGTQLDVTEDTDLTPDSVSPDDPRLPLIVQYWFLLYLLDGTLQALDT
jgi:hypothetical protein